MEGPNLIADDNLTDIAQYNPHLRLYLNEDSRDFVEDQLGDIRMMLYEWEGDMLKHRAVDIMKKALVNEEDWVVYRIMKHLDFNNSKLNKFVTDNAAIHSRAKVIEFMIKKGYNDWNRLAYCAALMGDRELLVDFIRLGANIWNMIAYYAALGGHTTLVNELIEGIGYDGNIAPKAKCYSIIAAAAAKEGHRDILYDILDKREIGSKGLGLIAKHAASNGYTDIVLDMIDRIVEIADHQNIDLVTIEDKIASSAAFSGHRDLVKEMINIGATNANLIASSAAEGGHREIVYEMIEGFDEFEANDWNVIAYGAAKGGDWDLLNEMIEVIYDKEGRKIGGANKWKKIASYAAKGGRKEIVLLMMGRGVDENSLDFAEHEDAKLYFS